MSKGSLPKVAQLQHQQQHHTYDHRNEIRRGVTGGMSAEAWGFQMFIM